jgi:uroporphyrinogen decarboxylase
MPADTGLDLDEPVEAPQGGDVTLAKAEEYGRRFCLTGNVNAFDTRTKGSPADVIAGARRCIADAGAGGSFMLSSGAEVAGDTSEESFVTLIGAAREYVSHEATVLARSH